MATSEIAKRLVEALKSHGGAFVVIGGTVAIIGPTLRSSPTMYNESELKKAVEDGLLQKRTWTVSDHTGKSWALEVYALPQD